jgi:hypothetical protein
MVRRIAFGGRMISSFVFEFSVIERAYCDDIASKPVGGGYWRFDLFQCMLVISHSMADPVIK